MQWQILWDIKEILKFHKKWAQKLILLLHLDFSRLIPVTYLLPPCFSKNPTLLVYQFRNFCSPSSFIPISMAIREMRLQASPNFLIANKKFSNFLGNTPSAHANAPPGSYKAVPPSGGGAVGVEQFVHELCTFGARNAAAAAPQYIILKRSN